MRDNGPWPADVDDIAVGDQLRRPVIVSDGSEMRLEVTVTSIELAGEDGDTTDGYAVGYHFDDPTVGGES